jgi:large subunit ribosomal protein L1
MAKEKTTAAKTKEKTVKKVVKTETAETMVETPTKVVKEPKKVKETKPLAKAGKRSAKAQQEDAEKQAKEERKADTVKAEAEKPAKPVAKPARTRLERSGKKFRAAAELIDRNKVYELAEAVALAVKTNPTKFDATLELHVNLNVDPKHADQNIRDSLVLPAGTGKTIRVAAFADDVPGADLSGVDIILKQLEKGEINFDLLVSTPANMAKLGKYARVLGPRGLMPNPKSGTVTADITKAVKSAKAGRVEYRVDSTGIIHLGVGKVSFGAEKLTDNLRAVFASIKSGKPASVKSTYVKAIHLTTTMGPSITVSTAEL